MINIHFTNPKINQIRNQQVVTDDRRNSTLYCKLILYFALIGFFLYTFCTTLNYEKNLLECIKHLNIMQCKRISTAKNQ